MSWLKENAFVAEWVASLIAVVALFMNLPRIKAGDIDWARTIIYFSTVIVLAVGITPQLDEYTKMFARSAFIFCMTVIIVDRKPRN